MGAHPERKRPVYLNLLKIRQPIGAIVSILHRVTGVLLVLFLVPALYAFDLSLRGPIDYQRVSEALSTAGGVWHRFSSSGCSSSTSIRGCGFCFSTSISACGSTSRGAARG